MRKLALVISILLSTFVTVAPEAHAAPSRVRCAKYSGRNFIVCAESGPQHLPYGLPPGKLHNPKLSTASGPCGFLKKTRQRYGGDSLRHCERYMRDRFGSWSNAEAFHRSNNWW